LLITSVINHKAIAKSVEVVDFHIAKYIAFLQEINYRIIMKALVAGYPIKHSLSPLIHNYWLKANAIDGLYDMAEVRPGELKAFLNTLPKGGYNGCNLTIPLKEEAMQVLANIDPFAKFIGAVNTVIIKDGFFVGTNTDFVGFGRSLFEVVDTMEGKNAVVLGGGGAARAVCFSLVSSKVKKLTIVNRNMERAYKIVQDFITNFNCPDNLFEIVSWDRRAEALADADLLVNTTSLGMVGQDELEIDLTTLPKTAVVYDVVYNPLETKLLADAKLRGNKTIDGLGMLMHQAAPSFEAFFGLAPDITPELRGILVKKLES
jgi:shikimate dehydrogenase